MADAPQIEVTNLVISYGPVAAVESNQLYKRRLASN